MRAFLEIAATGSFQLAAEKLFVTQSTISARIKVLEEQLNRPLFIRKRNGSELTAGGHHFYRHALTAVRAWERAQNEIALPEDLKAVINLGIQINHLEKISDPWLKWMNKNHPGVAANIISDYTGPLMTRLRDGLLDLAIVYDPQQRPDLVIEPYIREDLILVSSTPRNLHPRSIDDYVFIDWGESFRTQYNLAFPKAPYPRLTISTGSVGLNHILLNGGSGYFLESTVRPMIDTGQLFLVGDAPIFQRPTYLLYQKTPFDEKMISASVTGLREAITGA